MKTGVYRIFLKAKPTKFYIIGTANIEAYWSELGDKNISYSLIRECNKLELPIFTKHFIEKFKPTWDDIVEQAIADKPEMEKVVIEVKGKISGKDIVNAFQKFEKLPPADNIEKVSKPKKVVKKKK